MVPVWLFVVGPLCVVEVSLSSWLEIILLARAVLKGVRVEIYSLVDSVLNIVGLSLNRVA